MAAASVVVYLTSWCPYCHRAKSLLSEKGVSFKEVDVDERPELRPWLQEKTGQRTVPQVFVNSRSLGGFTDIAALDRTGKLDTLLAQAPTGGEPELRF